MKIWVYIVFSMSNFFLLVLYRKWCEATGTYLFKLTDSVLKLVGWFIISECFCAFWQIVSAHPCCREPISNSVASGFILKLIFVFSIIIHFFFVSEVKFYSCVLFLI